MKIDLEKELGLNQTTKPDNFPWLKAIVLLCAVNFILLIVLFFSSKSGSANASASASSLALMNSQFVANVSARLANIEQLQRQFRITQKKSTKDISIVSADSKLGKKRDRMKQKELKKSGLNDDEIDTLGSSLQSKRENKIISDNEKIKLDDLIDRDESGAQIRAYIRALPSAPQKKVVIEYLKRKGNQWFNATMPVLADNDPDADIYVDNTRYFFEIVRDVSDSSATIAYAGSKLNQLELAAQKAEFRRFAEDESINRQDELDDLKENLIPQETAEQAQSRIQRKRKRESIIKPYKSSKLTHPYKSDWDPDPRVREEQGIE